jgi:hypothetical protein
MLHRSKTTQTALRRGLFFTAAIVGLAHVALADAQPATVAPLMISGNQSARPPGTYSAGLAQIVKLLDAKMDAQVILAYIQNSPVAYNPDATELIALKDHGASPDVLVALLHHGNELRQQLAQTQRSVYPQPATTGYGYGNVPEGTYPAYPYGYSDVSYPTTYPVTYYNYGWPAVYWPPVPFNGYRPNLPPHGRFPIRGGEGRNMSGGVRPAWAPAAPPGPRGPRSVSAPIGGHGSFPAVQSGGFRGSVSPGGRPGGRAR